MMKITKKQVLISKQRLNRAQHIQSLELQSDSLRVKFKQLCFLMNSFRLTPADQNREKDVRQIRQHWQILKKQ